MFDAPYMSEIMKTMKRLKLLYLEYGDMSIMAYEQKFINLLTFSNGKQSIEEAKAKCSKFT